MSLHPKMKMEMMPLSVWTLYLWRGGGDGRVIARPAGTSCKWDRCRGNHIFLSFPDQGWDSWAARAGRLWGGARFCSAHCSSWPCLCHLDSRRGLWAQLSAHLYGVHRLDLFGTGFPFFSQYISSTKRQKMMGIEMTLPNWTILLASMLVSLPLSALENGTV